MRKVSKMKFFPKQLLQLISTIILMAGALAGISTGLLPKQAQAQIYPLIGNWAGASNFLAPFQNYGYGWLLGGSPFINPYAGWGGIASLAAAPVFLTALSSGWSGGYYGSNPMVPFSYGSGLQTLMEVLNTYAYLQYAIQFYEIARNVPLLYLRDIQADHIGAMMYSYADSLGVSPQEAVVYFIRENYFPQLQ
ncbi:MAG: hypothetical protein K6U11_06950 [bacterium]|nr:hypothetical protein [bacterium]